MLQSRGLIERLA